MLMLGLTAFFADRGHPAAGLGRQGAGGGRRIQTGHLRQLAMTGADGVERDKFVSGSDKLADEQAGEQEQHTGGDQFTTDLDGTCGRHALLLDGNPGTCSCPAA